ncbi:uncharacterized protein H6S33_005583 [Morchella sextelata]|uniref:uncharacterized protein n=1 Tax=Morchella sextelata TaxID=1174677 RepID=UPI001D03C8EE|nr:uncharacterized protein H6S33_005583 [Morchella sextelata]KAH0613697.1 hypothetical protein H6S33_005583 [Morchella sextelata]
MRTFESIVVCLFALYLTYYCRRHYSSTSEEILEAVTPIFENIQKSDIMASIKEVLLPATATGTPTASTLFEAPTVVPDTPSTLTTSRRVAKAFEAIEQSEGAGARVRRSVGTAQLRNFSPFLMLDHFTIGPGAGFPDHPHRGQETITYLLSGSVDHEDFAGNKGTIGPGDLQFMTAGKGIMHAEMPGLASTTPNVGLQLWVDLPTALKFCEPRYRDLRGDEIPVVEADDGKVSIKIISGESQGAEGVRELAYTPVWILDVTVKAGGTLKQILPKAWNAFLYILEGSIIVEGKDVPTFHNVVFEKEGDGIVVEGKTDARFVIIAGQPLDQPVVQHGPFVLNTKEQVYEAMRDYHGYQNGFERAEGWRSEIGKRMD